MEAAVRRKWKRQPVEAWRKRGLRRKWKRQRAVTAVGQRREWMEAKRRRRQWRDRRESGQRRANLFPYHAASQGTSPKKTVLKHRPPLPYHHPPPHAISSHASIKRQTAAGKN